MKKHAYFSSPLFVLLAFLLTFSNTSQAAIITVGTGTGTSGVYPINTCFGYNYTQTIYLASDLVAAGATSGTSVFITSIQFNQTTSTSPTNWKDWTIYMGNTSSTAFTSTTSWIPLSSLTKVFEGTVTPSGTGWYTITLSTPFLWNGTSNLAIAVDENTAGFNCTSAWQVTSVGSSPNFRSISYYSDGTNPDPASPPTATTRGLLYPNIKIDYTVATACSGTPSGGTAIASATTVCAGGTTTLSLSGATLATGISYQWETSSTGTGGWTPIAGATKTSLTIAPTSCPNAYYRCKVTCASSGLSAYSSTVVISVPCAIVPPYTETFESITAANQFPACMTATNIGSITYTYLSAPGTYNRINHTPGGSKFASFRWSANDYIFTPALQLTAGRTYKFSFWYITDGYSGWNSIGARLGTAPTAAAMTTTLATVTSPSNTFYQQSSTTFTVSTTGIYYLSLYCSATSAPWYLTVDDLNLEEVPPCSGAPVAGSVISTPSRICGTGSPTLSLSGTTTATGLTYRWESSSTGPSGVFTPIPGGTTATFTAPAISTTTCYRAVVKCSLTGDSSVTTPLCVGAGIFTTPYFEDFESITAPNQLPNCMTATSVAPYVYTYLVPTGSYNQINHTPGGSKFASFRYGTNDYLFTPGINLIAGRTYELSFWYITDGLSGWNTLSAKYGSAPTAAAMTTTIGTPIATPSNTTYQRFRTRFIASASGPTYIGIYCNGSTAPWYVTVDDIQLQELPPCAAKPVTGIPDALPAKVCGSGTTTLDLPGLTPALGFTYLWQDSVAGGTWGSGPGRPTFGGFSLPFTTAPFATTTYFRCIVTCAATGDTAISPALKVQAGALNPPYSENFESITFANQLPDCMSATSISPYVNTYIAPPGSYNRINHTSGGNKFATFRYGSNDYLFTPGINLLAGYRYVFSFWYITDGYGGWNTLTARVGRAPDATSMTTTIGTPVSNPSNTTYRQYVDTFIVPSSGIYYIGIYCNASSAPWYLTVDDINLQFVPCSGAPDAGIISASVPSGTPQCEGTPTTLINTGATLGLIPGISRRWEKSVTGAAPWVPITAATDTIYTSDSLVGAYYRYRVNCAVSGLTTYSPVYYLPALPPHPPVTIAPPVGGTTFCVGDTVYLNATNYAGAVYEWHRDGMIIPGWTFSMLGAVDPGVYTVKVTSSASPCSTSSASVTLNASDPGFKVDVTTPADSIICSGDSVNLSAMASIGGVSYQWRRNNVDIPGATGSSYFVTTSGYYRASASNGGACNALSRNIYFLVKPTPPAVITSPSPTLTACDNVGVELKANTGPGFIYQWSRNGAPIFGWTDSSILIKSPGIYTVKVRSADNCVSTSAGVTVKILPSPNPVITGSGGTVLSTVLPYSYYQWYRNGIKMPGETNRDLYLSYNGSYTVEVTDENGCTSMSLPFEVMRPDLGIEEQNINAKDILVYPNPTKDIVTVDAPFAVYVSLKDITGRVVIASSKTNKLDLSGLSDGLYIITVSNKDGKQLKVGHITKQSGY